MSVNVAIVGATGAVGVEFMQVLERRGFPIGKLALLASKRSAGTTCRRHRYRGLSGARAERAAAPPRPL